MTPSQMRRKQESHVLTKKKHTLSYLTMIAIAFAKREDQKTGMSGNEPCIQN